MIRFLVALPPPGDLLLRAKHLFVAAIVAIALTGRAEGPRSHKHLWSNRRLSPESPHAHRLSGLLHRLAAGGSNAHDSA
jgi:hypothetical protein